MVGVQQDLPDERGRRHREQGKVLPRERIGAAEEVLEVEARRRDEAVVLRRGDQPVESEDERQEDGEGEGVEQHRC